MQTCYTKQSTYYNTINRNTVAPPEIGMLVRKDLHEKVVLRTPLMFRLRRDAAECEPRLGPEAAVAEVGVTYVSTLLALAGAEDACLQLHVCHAARHVASLPDLGGVVARLNKVARNMDICTCIISILYIYILHYLQYLHRC